MRFVAAVLLWLLTTAALAVAVPAAWAQHNVVDEGGYSALATSAATDPAVQTAMAAELTAQLVRLAGQQRLRRLTRPAGRRRGRVHAQLRLPRPVRAGQPDRAPVDVHRRRPAVRRVRPLGDRPVADAGRQLVPADTLRDFGIQAPSTLVVPLTENVSDSLRPGQLRQLTRWGPWASVGAMVLTGVLALLVLAAARSRGKALASLGVSALLVGAAGWAGIEVGRRYLDAGAQPDHR